MSILLTRRASSLWLSTALGVKVVIKMESKRPSSNIAEFQRLAANAKYIVVLSGAGISAESGIPTFRGAGGFWRKYQATDLATPNAFKRDPSLVWEFYHYRREVVLSKQPNAAHKAIAECETSMEKRGRKLIVVTQNIDGLHQAAGSKNVVELHGSLFKTRCTKCHTVEFNRHSPICEALRGKGAPDTDAVETRIPVDQLPRCNLCSGLLRPHVVWFNENLEPDVLNVANEHLGKCKNSLYTTYTCKNLFNYSHKSKWVASLLATRVGRSLLPS